MAPMPRARNPFLRYRRVLLAAIAVLVVTLVALFLFGRSGRRPAQPAEEQRVETPPQGGITLVGEGFEFTHTEGSRKIFRIRGDSVRADRAGTVYLDGVALTLYDERGAAYEVGSREASFNRETRAARLVGDVTLRGPGPTELSTRGLRLEDRGQLLVSTGEEVRFRYGPLGGRADRLRVQREQGLYLLLGDVRVETLPDAEVPASLDCQRLVFEQPRHQVRAEGDVQMRRAGDLLAAARVNAFLDDADRSVLFVRARWEISGQVEVAGAEGGAGRTVRFSARSLSLLRDPDGLPRAAEMEGAAQEPVRIDSPAPDGHLQRLVAGFANASFSGGRLSGVEAYHQPRLSELPAGGRGEALRELSGKRLQAGFAADGTIASMRADEAVRYRDERLTAAADRARFDVAAGRGEMEGAPVEVVTERGEIYAPQVDYQRASGLVAAKGGVRALITQSSELGLDGTPFGGGDGPVRVESDEAFLREEPRAALFRGHARAWQGKSLLLAQSLRADEGSAGRQLTASGGVRTVWVPEGKAGSGGGSPGAGAPIEVTADDLRYDEGEDLLTYTGDVRSEQEERVLACRHLEVELSAAGQAERMTCEGETRLEDRRSGDTAHGDRATYDLAARSVTLTGEPAVLKKGDGGVVQGGRVTYSVDSGTARVVRETPAAATPPPAATPADPPPGPGRTTSPGAPGVEGGR